MLDLNYRSGGLIQVIHAGKALPGRLIEAFRQEGVIGRTCAADGRFIEFKGFDKEVHGRLRAVIKGELNLYTYGALVVL
jgi:hypothetical protein